MKHTTIDCVIIDDELVACNRLKAILDEFDSVQVTGVYFTYQDALENILQTQPEVIFLDIELDKNHNAFEIIDQLHSKCCFPQIIITTAFYHYAIKAIKKRVFDYLVKPIDIEELKNTLTRLERFIQSPSSALIETNSNLSKREKQVLELVLQGMTSHEIACQLFVSKSTIDSHRKNILKKTGARSIQELMRLSYV